MFFLYSGELQFLAQYYTVLMVENEIEIGNLICGILVLKKQYMSYNCNVMKTVLLLYYLLYFANRPMVQ